MLDSSPSTPIKLMSGGKRPNPKNDEQQRTANAQNLIRHLRRDDKGAPP